MTQIYEGMFLLDNDFVRADWAKAKSLVTGLIAKHGGTVLTARHWAERKLAYTIKRRDRATYLLAYFNLGADGFQGLRRDLDLSEEILRYLLTAAEAVPDGEAELMAKEETGEFSLPEPPSEEPEPEPEAPKAKAPAAEGEAKAAEKKADEGAEKKADEGEAKAVEKKAEEGAEEKAEAAPEKPETVATAESTKES